MLLDCVVRETIKEMHGQVGFFLRKQMWLLNPLEGDLQGFITVILSLRSGHTSSQVVSRPGPGSVAVWTPLQRV